MEKPAAITQSILLLTIDYLPGETSQQENTDEGISFGFTPRSTSEERDLKNISTIWLTVENRVTREAVLENRKLPLYRKGSSYLTVPIKLTEGNYSLKSFILISVPQTESSNRCNHFKETTRNLPAPADFTIIPHITTNITTDLITFDRAGETEVSLCRGFNFSVIQEAGSWSTAYPRCAMNFSAGMTDAWEEKNYSTNKWLYESAFS